MKVLITGTAGFIGYHTAKKILQRGDQVVGIDNINDYYDVKLKYGRLSDCGIKTDDIEWNKSCKSSSFENYTFIRSDISDKNNLEDIFKQEQPDKVCHLAAQAGVRYSLINPSAYIQANIVGFSNILECCRHHHIQHLTYASSSSVYGLNENLPFSTRDNVDHPVSLYAASKKSNELMAHTYSHLFQLPTTGLRFFTVYGPWGRPDMALFLFTKAIIENKPIQVFNHGKMERDFTYIDDIVEGIIRVIDNPPKPNPDWSGQHPEPDTSPAPYKIYNIGNNNSVKLLDFISEIENEIGKKAQKEFLPIQPGDVKKTWADVSDLIQDLNYQPHTPVKEGIHEFIKWYKEFYKIEKAHLTI